MKVALYTRVSSEEQAKGTSLASQKADLNKWAAAEGWEVVECYEEAVSGASTTRPEFHKAIADAERGEFSRLLVWQPDRFGRSLESAEAWLKLRAHGVEVWEGQDRRPLDEAQFAEELAAAIGERKKIRLRTVRGRQAAAQEGRWPGGHLPYGVTTDESGHLIEDPAQADPVREGARVILDGGSTGDVAREWNRQGLRSGLRHSEWTAQMIRKLYRQSRLSSGQIEKPGWGASLSHPVLIDPDDHRRIISVLDDSRSRRSHKTTGHRVYPLTGRLICPGCGHHWHGHPERQTPRYRCSKYYPRTNPDRCEFTEFKFVDAKKVEDMVWMGLFHPGLGVFMGDNLDNLRRAVADSLDVPSVSQADLDAARSEVAKIEAALERTDANRLIEDTERLRRATKRLAKDLDEARTNLNALEVTLLEAAEKSERWDAYQEAAERVRELASETDPAERKKVLDALDITATWKKKRIGWVVQVSGLLGVADVVSLMADHSTG